MNDDIWLIIIDDNPDAGGLLADNLEDYRRFFFTDPHKAREFLQGDHSFYPHADRLPPPKAAFVFVDLWLGHGEPNGVDVVAILRTVTRLPVWAVLHSLEAINQRELVAISAAEVWGEGRTVPGIHYIPKETSKAVWDELKRVLRDLSAQIPSDRTPPNQFLSSTLQWIKPLTLVASTGVECSFLEWLAKPTWRLPYLRLVATGHDVREARRVVPKTPKQPRDIANHFREVLGAHQAQATNGHWRDHQGRLLMMEGEEFKGDHLIFIAQFAASERFLFASETLPVVIEDHLVRRNQAVSRTPGSRQS
jgi:hypothetical protein